mmetsp:Transcript_68376/g.120735  ORF Transcript_68376/g.120735 Transcript_68376/m.120735 type:complete len:215 (-) Transcript_68376:844-1488(-)
MAILSCEGIELPLQLATPSRHEVDVLQHHPMPFFVTQLELLHGDFILALPHGDVVIVGICLQLDGSLPKCLNLLDRIGPRREDEEERRDVRGILVRGAQDLVKGQGGVAVNVLLAVGQRIPYPSTQSSGHAIRPQAADYQQFLEVLLIETLPVQRQLHVLWSQFLYPVPEAIGGISLHVLPKHLEAFQFIQLQHHGPGLIWQPVCQRIFSEGGY